MTCSECLMCIIIIIVCGGGNCKFFFSQKKKNTWFLSRPSVVKSKKKKKLKTRLISYTYIRVYNIIRIMTKHSSLNIHSYYNIVSNNARWTTADKKS